jgi:hypothetical protein
VNEAKVFGSRVRSLNPPLSTVQASEISEIPNRDCISHTRDSCRSYLGSCTFSLRRASLIGRVVRGMDAMGGGLFSAMAAVLSSAIDRFDAALGVLGVMGSGSAWC